MAIGIVLLSFVFLAVLVIFFSWKKKDMLNIYVLLLFSFFIVYVLPFLNPDSFFREDIQFSAIISVGILGGCAMFFFFYSRTAVFFRKKENIESFVKFESHPGALNVLAFIGVLFLWVTIFVALPSFEVKDLVAFFLRDRVELYLERALEYNFVFAGIKIFFTFAIYIKLVTLWKKSMTSGWFLFGTLVFDLLVFSHTRFVLLSLLSLPLIFRHCFVKKFGFKKAGLILVVFIFLISFLNLVRTGRFLESDQENNGNSLQKLIRQFQTAGNKSTETFFKMYEEIQSENVDFEYGKQFLITLMTPVPRKLWEDKPITSYFWRLTRQLEGQYPGPGQKVLTSTLFGEMYHQFGVVGVFVSSFIFLFIIFSLVYWLRRYENSDFIIWLQVIAIPMGIRGSLSSLLVKSIIVAAIFFVLSVFVYRPKTGNDSVAQAGADLTLFPF